MTEKEQPKGYTCECGAEHKFPAYVFAHWYEELFHTCDKCGAKHSVLRGHAQLEPSDEA